MSRTYYHDFETGRSGFTDGDLPDGPLVEEITAREFYLNEGHSLSCGWPKAHWPDSEGVCPCGFIFPARYHEEPINADDEALQ